MSKKRPPLDRYYQKLTSLKRKTILSMGFLIFREFALKILAIIGQLILIRILIPEYFGIFAIISFVISIIDLFTDIGLTQAIIRKKDVPDIEWLSSIFFAKFFLTMVSIIMLICLSPVVKMIFPKISADYLIMLWVLSFSLLLNPYTSIITSLLERELNYRAIPIVDIFGIISYYFAAIFFAIHGFQVWSFIWAVFIKEIIEVIILAYYKPWIPKLHFNIKEIKDLMHFGVYFQLSVIIGVIHNSVIPVLGGLKTSPYYVGLLDWSYNVGTLPQAVTDNAGRIAFASLAKVQDDTQLLSLSIERSIGLVSIFTLFYIVVVIGFGKEIVYFFLTNKWLPAIPALYWFAGSSLFIGAISVIQKAIIIKGATKQLFHYAFIIILLEWIIGFFLLPYFGFIVIAVLSFASSVSFFISCIMIAKKLGFQIKLTKVLFPKVLLFICALLIAVGLNMLFKESFILLIAKIFILTILYIPLLFLIIPEEMKKHIKLFKDNLRVNPSE